MKTKGLNEVMFLALLEKVLPKVCFDKQPDVCMANRAHFTQTLSESIYDEVAKEVRLAKNLQAFDKFCETGALPDCEHNTITNFTDELHAKFGADNVEVIVADDEKKVDVEITLPDRTVSHVVKVDATILEEEVKVPMVPFPVSLPEDPELTWLLARREDLGPDEAARALANIEAEFWETKKGLELQKKRVEKCFAEFIIHVPASALKDSGLKRLFKTPEPLKELRLFPNAEGGKA